MEKHFLLTVALGSVIHSRDFGKQVLTGVPKNALELWENGSQTLVLKKDGAEILDDFSQERLKKVIALRTPLKYKGELETLKKVLSAKKADKPDVKEKAADKPKDGK